MTADTPAIQAPKTKRKPIDWEAIERQYRLGQKSLRAIADQYGLAHVTIFKKAKKKGWVQDKTNEIRERTRAALVTSEANNPTPEDIEAAVKTNIDVIRGHQKLISRMSALANRLMDKSDDTTVVDEKMHGEMFKVVSQGLAKIIPLERQAFNIDDRVYDPGGNTIRIIYDTPKSGSDND